MTTRHLGLGLGLGDDKVVAALAAWIRERIAR